jgi:uncharacterized protein DUF3175
MSTRRAAPQRRWSQHVTETSDALDLEPSVFARGSARQVARSLQRSAEQSQRRKSSPYRSAMSMLTFYLNRGGKNLSPARRKVLEGAKDELRRLYHRT